MKETIPPVPPMHTVDTLRAQFESCGVAHGQILLVHSSMKAIGGWICGGAETVVRALMAALGEAGTLVMPTHTTQNSDPSYWEIDPIPPEWWQPYRDTLPPYEPAITRTFFMGAVPETFRIMPAVQRSTHPYWSMAAWGKHASAVVHPHMLAAGMGDESPLGRLYALDAAILLLGVGHGNNTTLHLAEHRARIPRTLEKQGCAMLINGQRQWVNHDLLAIDAYDFVELGAAYENAHPAAVRLGSVGGAATRWMQVRPLVDYAVTWLEQTRNCAPGDASAS
jgi:aminoglycoside 3-N-acetyltransferase